MIEDNRGLHYIKKVADGYYDKQISHGNPLFMLMDSSRLLVFDNGNEINGVVTLCSVAVINYFLKSMNSLVGHMY